MLNNFLTNNIHTKAVPDSESACKTA